MVKPNMSKKEDIEEIVNSAVEKTTKKIFDIAVGTEGKKLSEVLKDIKNKPLEDTGKKEGVHNHEYDIDCPGCSTQSHAHKLKNDKGVLKCVGNDCGAEFVMVPKTQAEYVCESCGQAHVKIDTKNKELRKNDKCINCGKDEFVPIGYKIDKK